MRFDPDTLERKEASELLNGVVGPRPIAWVSTLSASGVRNLAPFSYFNAFSVSPLTIGISPGSRSGVNKDTLKNIRATREFVVNVVSEHLAEQANMSSAEVPPDVDEWELAGVTPAASAIVTPARVSESLAALECRAFKIVDLGRTSQPTNSLVIARVVSIFVADEALDGLTPKPEVLRLVGRMGGDLWVTSNDRFLLRRPGSPERQSAR